jgi:hypothetical protein
MYGPITVDWQRTDTHFTLRTEVPANTVATIHLPALRPTDIREGGQKLSDVKGIRSTRVTPTEVVLELGSGKYDFEVTKLIQR